MMKFLLSRLREPSTLAGLGVLAVMIGAKHDQVEAVTQVMGALAGAAAVLIPERKGAQ